MSAQPSYAPPPPPAPPPSGMPPWLRWVGLGCGALLLLVATVAVLFFLVIQRATAGPEQAVQGFLSAAGSGDYEAAHAYFAAPLQQVQPIEQFRAIAAANQHLFQVEDTTFNNRSVDLSGAELSGSVTLASGTDLPASFRLVKEEGEWRLVSYQIGS